MISTRYEDHEEDFLKSIATEYGFTGITWHVFIERFSQKNIDVDNAEIAESLYLKDTIIPTRKDQKTREYKKPVPDQIFQYHLNKNICDKFEKDGCDYEGATKARWKKARKWLEDVKYPEWLAKHPDRLLRNLWQQLWEKVTSFEGITIKTSPELAHLGIDPAAWGEKEEQIFTIGWDNKLSYEVNSQQPGYLTLIQKYSSGELYLFSPSCLVIHPYQPTQKHIFPSAKCSFLPLQKYVTGMELLVAIISQKNPSFSWIKAEDQKPLQLEDSNLQELLEFIDRESNCEIIGTKFRIVEPANSDQFERRKPT